MIQHIVLWTFKDGVDKPAAFAELKRGFDAFAPEVPGLLSLKLYLGFQGYDVCLVSTHKDRQALEDYQLFPAHLDMKLQVAALRKDRAACDMDVPV